MIPVYDPATGSAIYVTEAEARAGMIRYARSLGAGTPACGEVERQAIARPLDPMAAFSFYQAATEARA
jgi:hypothetical protein